MAPVRRMGHPDPWRPKGRPGPGSLGTRPPRTRARSFPDQPFPAARAVRRVRSDPSRRQDQSDPWRRQDQHIPPAREHPAALARAAAAAEVAKVAGKAGAA